MGMTGHLQILQARKDGLKPSCVIVELGSDPVITCKFDQPENALDSDLFPTVFVPESEMKKQHDWRFLTDCLVLVFAEKETDEFFDQIDSIAKLAFKMVANCNGEIIEMHDGEWNAYANATA